MPAAGATRFTIALIVTSWPYTDDVAGNVFNVTAVDACATVTTTADETERYC